MTLPEKPSGSQSIMWSLTRNCSYSSHQLPLLDRMAEFGWEGLLQLLRCYAKDSYPGACGAVRVTRDDA